MYKGVWSDETKRTKQKRRTKNVKKERDRHKWSKKEGVVTKTVGSWGEVGVVERWLGEFHSMALRSRDVVSIRVSRQSTFVRVKQWHRRDRKAWR